MNLVEFIAKEHSQAQCLKVVRYVGRDPERFRKLIAVFLAGPYRITQRASWPLSVCVERHPELIRPHLKKVVQHLGNEHLHDAVKRNILRLLQFIAIPKSLQGVVWAKCYAYLQNAKEPIAVRVFSMTVLGNLGERTAELDELRIIIEDQLPYASAGFLSRARKILKQLK